MIFLTFRKRTELAEELKHIVLAPANNFINEIIGGADEIRTRDLLRDRETP